MEVVGDRKIVVLGAGGTIAMSGDPGSAVTPALDAGALIAAVPGLAVDEARTVRGLPGVHLTLADALAIAREAVAEAAGGAGVVVTTGTDTLEELAALIDAIHGPGGPVVLTGAIRPASAPGADGPANLLDAVAAARGLPGGAWVVFAGELHAAREARKVDSTSPRAFGSPLHGPRGFVAEGHVRLDAPQAPNRTPLDVRSLDGMSVPIIPTWLGDDGALLGAAIDAAPDAIVLVALGAGHVSPRVLARVREAPMPIGVAVRPERGAFLRSTYGFEGAEGDLRAAGVLPMAAWSPQAARMRLLAALGAGLRGEALRAALADPG